MRSRVGVEVWVRGRGENNRFIREGGRGRESLSSMDLLILVVLMQGGDARW